MPNYNHRFPLLYRLLDLLEADPLGFDPGGSIIPPMKLTKEEIIEAGAFYDENDSLIPYIPGALQPVNLMEHLCFLTGFNLHDSRFYDLKFQAIFTTLGEKLQLKAGDIMQLCEPNYWPALFRQDFKIIRLSYGAFEHPARHPFYCKEMAQLARRRIEAFMEAMK